MEKKRNKSFEGLLLGAVRISVEPGDLIDLLNILLELGERYRNIRKDDHSASVDLSYPAVTKVKRKCAERGIKADAELLYGIPYLYFYLIMRRPGLIAGLMAAIFIVAAAVTVIWDVRVECDGALSEDSVLTLLSAHGVHPGARKSKLDIGRIQADIEGESEDIAWISVNVIGTVAYVEVICEVQPPPEAEIFDGVNLVASQDGVVTGYEIISGEAMAEIGHTVKRGDLLVSGLFDSERFGYRAVEAEGCVFARTEEEFSVEIPLEYTAKYPEKTEIREISLIFFALRQKIFKKGGFSGASYDIIYSDIYIYNFNGKTIPAGLSVGRHVFYTEETKKRRVDEAADLAHLEINRQILSALPTAEILSRSYKGEVTEDGTAYRLVCRVNCIRDIALPKPFDINLSE